MAQLELFDLAPALSGPETAPRDQSGTPKCPRRPAGAAPWARFRVQFRAGARSRIGESRRRARRGPECPVSCFSAAGHASDSDTALMR